MNKDPLKDLLDLIDEEPEDVSLETLAAEGVIRLYQEPEHSKAILLKFQSMYGVHSLDVAAGTSRVMQLASERDLADWRWAIKQYVAAGGVLDLLQSLPHGDWFGSNHGCTSPSATEPGREQDTVLPCSIAAWLDLA